MECFRGQSCRFILENYNIYIHNLIFFRTIVKSAKPLHTGDISRPLHDTLRHTAHGSPFGKTWGTPSDQFGDENVIERNLTLDKSSIRSIQKSHDRSKKCVSENFVKERKSNALKQFSYNKLVNEHVKSKPNRPPQPSLLNNSTTSNASEGMLIDLSPTENSLSRSMIDSPRQIAMSQTATKSNICILDEPIEVPTESFDIIDNTSIMSTSISPTPSTLQRRIEPPPYREPPTYSNTIDFSNNTIESPRNVYNKLPENDPFDTSTFRNTSKSYSTLPINNVSPTPSRSNYASSPLSSASIAAAAQMLSNLALNDSNRLSNSNQDTQNSSLNITKCATNIYESKFNTEVLNSLSNAQINQPIKLDKISLAELEKDLYVNEKSNKNLNIANDKYSNDTSNRDIYEKTAPKIFNNIAAASNQPNLYAPTTSSTGTIYQTTKNINQEVYSNTRSNYQLSNNLNIYANNMPSTPIPSSSSSAQNISKNYESMQKISNLQNSDQLKLNLNQLYESRNPQINTTQNHEYVAVANRPVSTAFPPLPSIPPLTMPENLYSSVSGDIYSSVIYDTASGSSVSPYGHIEPSLYNNVMESAIYDEVAELRPHRPAPQAPQGQVLSAQQIQRRLEKQQHQQQIYSNTSEVNSEMQKIQLFLNDVGDQATYEEARQVLASCNWDHSAAVRNYKIENLLR